MLGQCSYHTENSRMIRNANQLTGFYTMGISALNILTSVYTSLEHLCIFIYYLQFFKKINNSKLYYQKSCKLKKNIFLKTVFKTLLFCLFWVNFCFSFAIIRFFFHFCICTLDVTLVWIRTKCEYCFAKYFPSKDFLNLIWTKPLGSSDIRKHILQMFSWKCSFTFAVF